MFGLGTREIIILAGLLVLLFGSKKIPELARGIGEAIKYVRNGFSDEPEEEEIKGKTNKNRQKE